MSIPTLENTYAITNKHFNTSLLAHYHLAIGIGPSAIKLCCVNSTRDTCLFLHSYKCKDIQTHQYVQLLEQIYKLQSFLKENSWLSVTLAIANQKYTLVPPQLFDREHIRDYAFLAFPMSGKEKPIHFTHNKLHTTVVGAVATNLLSWFQTIYSTTTFQVVPQVSGFIEGANNYLLQKTTKKKAKIFIWFEEQVYVHMVVMHKQKLHYYNQFSATNEDTCTRYLLAAVAALPFPPTMYEVIVAGKNKEGGGVYKNICKYLPDISFKEKNSLLTEQTIFLNIKRATSMVHFDIASAFLCSNSDSSLLSIGKSS